MDLDFHVLSFEIENGVKTNWQKLILEYNYNTAVEGDWEGKTVVDGYEFLPMDLPVPDYTKLANI